MSATEYDDHLKSARSAVGARPELVPSDAQVRAKNWSALPLVRDACDRYRDRTGKTPVTFLMASLVGQVVRREI